MIIIIIIMSVTVINPGGPVPQIQTIPQAGTIQTFPNPGTVQTTQGQNRDVYASYSSTMSIMTGCLRIVLVIIAVILDIIATSNGSWLVFMRYMTVWCGLCLISSGVLGIVAGVKKSSPTVVAHMVVSIVSCSVFAPIQCILGGIAWPIDQGLTNAPHGYAAAITIIGMAQLALNIWGSALGCSASCCNTQPVQTQTVTAMYVVQNGPSGQSLVPLSSPGQTMPVELQKAQSPPPYSSLPPAVPVPMPAAPSAPGAPAPGGAASVRYTPDQTTPAGQGRIADSEYLVPRNSGTYEQIPDQGRESQAYDYIEVVGERNYERLNNSQDQNNYQILQ